MAEMHTCLEQTIDTMGSQPGSVDLEDCISTVEAEVRSELVKLKAYDIQVIRRDITWANRIEIAIFYKILVPESEARAMMAKAQARKESLN